ncbi:SSI family serine proteinase inhibitor [Streptosporangium sp. G11]|uniref:SSI family serine proteinase inhibitor n=1 Tax=Streptosporangium sp. G11 TaxID=3436926 RepID=UPI003EB8F7BA
MTPPVVIPPWGPTIGGPRAKRLTLTVSRPGGMRTVRLGCTPVYGTHPRAVEACALLSRARGNPASVRLPWTGCLQQYDPIAVSATGVWNGRPVQYQRTFSNPCELRAATGVIFSF